MNKAHTLKQIVTSVMAVFLFSMYLVINGQVLDALQSSPYHLFLLEIAVVAIPFFLIPRWRKQRIRVTLWQLLLILAPIIGMLIFHQFHVLGVEIPNLFSGVIKANLSAWIHLIVFGGFLLSALCTALLIIKTKEPFSPIHLAIGLCLQIWLSTLLASVGFLNLMSALFICVAPILIQYKSALQVTKKIWSKKFTLTHGHLHQVVWLSAGLVILSYLLINMMKPIPLGHDGNTLYFYLSHQIAQSGSWLSGHQPYGLSIYLSMPEILLGSASYSVFHAHAFGFLILAVLLDIFQRNMTILARSIFLVLGLGLPYMTFHWFVDEKIDFGLTFIILALVHGFWKGTITNQWQFAFGNKNGKYPYSHWVVFMFSICLTIKYSSAFYLLAAPPTYLWYKNQREWASIYSLSLLGLLLSLPSLSYINTAFNEVGHLLSGISLILASGFCAFWWRKKIKFILPITAFQALAGVGIACLTIGPWTAKHLSEHGIWSWKNMLIGKEKVPDLINSNEEENLGYLKLNSLPGTRQLTLNFDNDNPTAKFIEQKQNSTDSKNHIAAKEIQRYQGLETGSAIWWSLLSDTAFNVNLPGSTSNHLGIIFILLILVLIIKLFNSKTALTLSAMILSYILISINPIRDHLANIGHSKVTTWGSSYSLAIKDFRDLIEFPGQVLFKIGQLMLPVSNIIDQTPEFAIIAGMFIVLCIIGQKLVLKSTRYGTLWFGVLSSTLFWLASGYGIVWYNLAAWILLLPLLLHSALHYKKTLLRKIAKCILLGQLMVILTCLSTSLYPEQQEDILFTKVNLDYSFNPLGGNKNHLKSLSIPVKEVLRKVNSSDANILIVNTELGYFINNFNGRILKDDYLDTFNELLSFGRKTDLLTKALQDSNFKFILLDLRTANVNGTNSQELYSRTTSALKFLQSSGLYQLAVTDNIIQSKDKMIILPDGRRVQGTYGLKGNTIKIGSFALFELDR